MESWKSWQQTQTDTHLDKNGVLVAPGRMTFPAQKHTQP